jgi:LysM repeat protein
VAQRAGMAAPALAVTGALAAAPQALAAGPPAHAPSASPGTGGQRATLRLDTSVRPVHHATKRTYRVQTGDTLSGIAKRFYGQASEWKRLYTANASRIRNPDLIYTGQVLVIPGRHALDALASTSQSPTDTADVTPVSQSSASTQSQSSSGSSSASLSSSVQQDIAAGNNLMAIAQYMVENGYSKAAAAGIASCIDGESLGNPESVGDGGGGLIGWTPLSSARPNENIVTGNPQQDMMTQLADILYYNSNEIGQAAVNELNSVTDPVAAADFYSQNFERPAVTDGDVQPSVAEEIFAALGG